MMYKILIGLWKGIFKVYTNILKQKQRESKNMQKKKSMMSNIFVGFYEHDLFPTIENPQCYFAYVNETLCI